MNNRISTKLSGSRGPAAPGRPRSGRPGPLGAADHPAGGPGPAVPAGGPEPEDPTAVRVVPTPGHTPPVRAVVRLFTTRDWAGRETVMLRVANEGPRTLPAFTLALALPPGSGPGESAVEDLHGFYRLSHHSDETVRPRSGTSFVLLGDLLEDVSHRSAVVHPDDAWCRLLAGGQEIGRVPVRGLQAFLGQNGQ
ncbi:MAG: hypothetical protein JWO38_8194 [Gemmataceae bacterium]|nr:hypothetical protein [Gemmataceae bacterium]